MIKVGMLRAFRDVTLSRFGYQPVNPLTPDAAVFSYEI
jgi:hypothetical protein